MPRRRPDTLLPLELRILEAAMTQPGADDAFYGFGIARRLADDEGTALTAHGTLYKALNRMAAMGLLQSHWEDAETAELEGRPRRRLYRLTADGVRAAVAARAADAPKAAAARVKIA